MKLLDDSENTLNLVPAFFNASWMGNIEGKEPVEDLRLTIGVRIQPDEKPLGWVGPRRMKAFTERYTEGSLVIVSSHGQREKDKSGRPILGVIQPLEKNSVAFHILVDSTYAASIANLLARTSYHYFKISVQSFEHLWEWNQKEVLYIERWSIDASIPMEMRPEVERAN